MKLLICDPEMRRPLKLVLPTGLLKSPFVWKMLMDYSDAKSQKTLLLYKDAIQDCLAELHRYRKNYGSFRLIEVESSDGSTVIITI